MASYKLAFKKSVSKDLKNIPDKDVKRILARIDLLRTNPYSVDCSKVVGQNRYRVRQGVYRILYEIKEGQLIIVVVKVAHRSKVYARR